MSDEPQGPGWWYATDGRWYPPEMHPDHRPDPEPPPPEPPPVVAPVVPPGWSPTGAAVPPSGPPPTAAPTGGWTDAPAAGVPPSLGVPRAAPPPRGRSTGRVVAIVLAIVLSILGVLVLLGVLLGVGVFATQDLATDATPDACRVERDTLETARSAAAVTPDPADTQADYLAGPLLFFQPDGQRLPDTLADVNAQDCPPLGPP